MESTRNSLANWWLKAFRPWNYSWLETLVMRMALASTVFYWLWPLKPWPMTSKCFSVQDEPVGLSRLFDLTWLSNNEAYTAVMYSVAAAALLYVVMGFARLRRDVLTPIALTIACLGISLVRGNQNSNGAVHHGYQLVALVLLSQAIYHWVAFFRTSSQATAGERENWAVYFSLQTIAASYVVAGISKLKNGGLAWVWDSPMLAVHMARTGDEYYYDTLEPSRLGELDPYIQWFIDHPNLVRIGMGGSLLLELTAFLALLGPRWALVMGIAIQVMHWGIGESMHLFFLMNQVLILAFLINIPRWLLAAKGRFGPAAAKS